MIVCLRLPWPHTLPCNTNTLQMWGSSNAPSLRQTHSSIHHCSATSGLNETYSIAVATHSRHTVPSYYVTTTFETTPTWIHYPAINMPIRNPFAKRQDPTIAPTAPSPYQSDDTSKLSAGFERTDTTISKTPSTVPSVSSSKNQDPIEYKLSGTMIQSTIVFDGVSLFWRHYCS